MLIPAVSPRGHRHSQHILPPRLRRHLCTRMSWTGFGTCTIERPLLRYSRRPRLEGTVGPCAWMGVVVATSESRPREVAQGVSPTGRVDQRAASWLPRMSWVVPTLGLGTLLLYASQFSAQEMVSVVATGVMVLGAGILVGGLLGFLFGIPRTLQGGGPPADRGSVDATDAREPAYLVNTNLEQISDWLTKILVGVGLIQLGKIGSGSGRLVDFLAGGLGGLPSSRVLAAGLVAYSTVAGFLTGYLLTRLYLTPAFKRADVEGLRSRVEKAEKVSRQAQEAAEEAGRKATSAVRDVLALGLVDRQLNPKPGDQPVSQEELSEALEAATPALRAQAYLRAQRQREASWKTNPAIMERTIPVFRALIASDSDGRYHRNHADLGYALKDKRPPDYAAAEAALTEAIRLRDSRHNPGWRIYEFNRALCRIMSDENLAKREPASDERRSAVIDDLRAALSRDPPRQLVERVVGNEQPWKQWLEANATSLDELLPSVETAE